MDRIRFNYSLKNIPVPGKKQYLKQLLDKTEQFVKNIRWRAFFFLNPTATSDVKETFGFRSTRPTPVITELKEFEDGMLNIVQNIKFRSTTSPLQREMEGDIKRIQTDKYLYVPADKTSNFYKVSPEEYNKLIDKNIHKKYKKSTGNAEIQTTLEDKQIADNLKLSDRIDTLAKNDAFITLKDHKPNFKSFM